MNYTYASLPIPAAITREDATAAVAAVAADIPMSDEHIFGIFFEEVSITGHRGIVWYR